MKKAIGVTISMIVVGVLALAIVPTTRDEIHWQWVSHKDETAGYESYVKTWPDGRHTSEGKARYDVHGWNDATATNTVQGYERYVQLHGNGKHVGEAKDNIESLHWQEATAINTVQGFERYVQLHGDGKHVGEAKDNIASLEFHLAITKKSPSLLRDFTKKYPNGKQVEFALRELSSLEDTAWKSAIQNNTVELFKGYLGDYPDAGHAKEAKARIQILGFQSGFGIAAVLTDKQLRTYIEQLENETYSATINSPVTYYRVSGTRCNETTIKTKEIIQPKEIGKACSLKLELGDLSITAYYSSNTSIKHPLFINKRSPQMTHNGCSGPGLELKSTSQPFLRAFSIEYHSIAGSSDYVIPDLILGADETAGNGHKGEIFKRTNEIIKIEGREFDITKLPESTMNYKTALAIKTYIMTIAKN